MYNNLWKMLLVLIGSALVIPLVTGGIVGGGYILFFLLQGHSINESLKSLMDLQEVIQPYVKYLMLIFILPIVFRAFQKN